MVGSVVQRFRRKRGMTQEDLAVAVGITQPQVSRLELDQWEAPREVLIRIAEELSAPQILTEAVRNSEMMRAAMAMLGIRPSTDAIFKLLEDITSEVVAIHKLAHGGANYPLIKERADRLAELSHLLQMIIPLPHD